MMPRTLQAELLDTLSPNDPDAQHNRRDLRVTNHVMGNHRWVARELPRLLQPDETALEIGAGSGELCQRLLARHVPVDGLDLWPPPPNWPSSRRWHQADLLKYSEWHRYDAIIGNLIFHQFNDLELAELGARFRSHARVIVACEPVRRKISQTLYGALGPLFGANHVSLHDAHVSIAAGFCGEELPRLLALDPAVWDYKCTTTALGAYRMVAVRRP